MKPKEGAGAEGDTSAEASTGRYGTTGAGRASYGTSGAGAKGKGRPLFKMIQNFKTLTAEPCGQCGDGPL